MIPTEFISATSGASGSPHRHFRSEKSHHVFRKRPFSSLMAIFKPIFSPELHGCRKGFLRSGQSEHAAARVPEGARRPPGASQVKPGVGDLPVDQGGQGRGPAPGSIGGHFSLPGALPKALPALSERKIAHTFEEAFILDSERRYTNVSAPELHGHGKGLLPGNHERRVWWKARKNDPRATGYGIPLTGRSRAIAITITGTHGNPGPARGGRSS
jgi:hypothetical protein